MQNWQLLLGLESYLRPLVEAERGSLQVARSLQHARGMLSTAPKQWSLILHYEGTAPHPQALGGMTYHRVATVIQQAAGLALDRGAAIHRTAAGAEPFLRRIEQVSAWMRALKFPDGLEADPAGFSLEESDWVETTEHALAHSLSFQLEAALPAFPANALFTIPD